MNYFDKLPIELIYYIKDILESNRRFHAKIMTINHLEKNIIRYDVSNAGVDSIIFTKAKDPMKFIYFNHVIHEFLIYDLNDKCPKNMGKAMTIKN